MIYTGADHTCGHPMVVDNEGDPHRCAVCHPSPTWHWATRPHHPHNVTAAA